MMEQPWKRALSRYVALSFICVLIAATAIVPVAATNTYYVHHSGIGNGGETYSYYNGAKTYGLVPRPEGSEWTVHIHPYAGWKVNQITVTDRYGTRSFGHSNPWDDDDAYTFYNINQDCYVSATFIPK